MLDTGLRYDGPDEEEAPPKRPEPTPEPKVDPFDLSVAVRDPPDTNHAIQ